MPLSHGKSKKAFSKNVEIEMNAGKPQKQALAIAYSVKRKSGKKMAKGGQLPPKDYTRGVHKDINDKGESFVGETLRNQNHHDQPEAHHEAMVESAKRLHNKKLAEMKSMKKPVLPMAEGGSVKNEKRPMPNDLHNDSIQAHQNEGRKPLKNSYWTDNSTVKQAQSNNGRRVMPIASPKNVPSDAFSVRMYNKEGHLEDAMPPSSPADQPESDYNELDAKKMGKSPKVHPEHNNGKMPYHEDVEHDDTMDEAQANMKQPKFAKGGKISEQGKVNHEQISNMYKKLAETCPPKSAEREAHETNAAIHAEKAQKQKLAKGGEINDFEPMHDAEEDQVQHPAGLEEDDDQMGPSMHEYMSDRMPAFADGGEIDEDQQPAEEEEMEHHDSIASAIMAKRAKMHAHIDSGAMDEDHAADDEDASFPSEDHPAEDQDMYAKGGEIMKDAGKILSADSIYPSKSSQADLSRNHDEDANMEDQTSFNALRKENYNSSNLDIDQPEDSNEKGDEREAARSDRHDMIAKIRAKRSKIQFK
jgi:hypothetical protein